MVEEENRRQLVHILRAAYSGELAAAYAYRGHWKSVKDPREREQIRRIENEEWVHRAKVGRMLEGLRAGPATVREARMWLTGRAIGLLCHLIGWFLPMYFAGRLESRNVKEYDSAACYAGELGLCEYENELRIMAAVEKDHEIFFMRAVANHRLLPLMQSIFGWGEAGLKPAPDTKPDVSPNS
jgi:demethoxyubiquinone hydroxylase (CLK1/Coq7/Cat5 family)